MKMPPGTRRTIKIAVTTKPKIVNQVVPTENEPKPTKVDLLATIKPPSCNPRKAMNNPIPPEIAYFKSDGIASMIISRSLKIVITIKIKLATNTPAKAVCQGIFIPIQTEYAKNALIPSAGAVAIGYFAKIPINMQPSADAKAVAVNTAPLSIPEAPSTDGLTNKI